MTALRIPPQSDDRKRSQCIIAGKTVASIVILGGSAWLVDRNPIDAILIPVMLGVPILMGLIVLWPIRRWPNVDSRSNRVQRTRPRPATASSSRDSPMRDRQMDG